MNDIDSMNHLKQASSREKIQDAGQWPESNESADEVLLCPKEFFSRPTTLELFKGVMADMRPPEVQNKAYTDPKQFYVKDLPPHVVAEGNFLVLSHPRTVKGVAV